MSTKPKPDCECGCNEPTKGGKFLPGHDAKLKARLIREVIAGGNPGAEQELASRGWISHLERKLERMSKTPEQLEAERAARAEQRRQETERRIALMKEAGEVLRTQGRYCRSSDGYIEVTAHNAELIIEGKI